MAPHKDHYLEKAQAQIDAIKKVLGSYCESAHHIGSTSIKGMPGKPQLDLTFVTPKLMPDIPDEILEGLDKIGYKYCGVAPHHADKFTDQWFLYDTPNSPDGIKGYVVHFVDCEDTIIDFVAFRDYCRVNPEFFKRYLALKERCCQKGETVNQAAKAKEAQIVQMRLEAKRWKKQN